MQPSLGVHMIATQGAVMRRSREKDDIGTSIIFARSAVVTSRLGTRNAALDGDSVTFGKAYQHLVIHSTHAHQNAKSRTWFEPCHLLACFDHHARALMTKPVLAANNHVADVAVLPKVHI